MAISSLIPRPRVKPTTDDLEKFQKGLRDNRVSISRETRQTIDAFQNQLARIGWGTSNLSEGANYPLTRLSRNFILMTSLYRGSWIARKIVDCIAEDMLKNWINLVTDLPPAKIKDFNRAVIATGTKGKLLEAIKWARLYGGSAAIMMIKGQSEELDKELDLDSVAPNSYAGLLVLDRWSGISPLGQVCTDLDKPTEFGLPEAYQVTTESRTFQVHASRVLRFTGRSLPWWEWLAEQRWGISEFELIFDELKKRDNTSWNIASLVFRANIFSVKFKELAANLSGLGKSMQAQQEFYNILQAQNQLMSNQGILVLPESGGIETHQYAFSGINEVYESFMLDICGASEIPMSRLFGRTYSGLGQTNIGDEHTYYDIVGQKQQRELDPQLQKLLPVIALSTYGKIPKEFEWFFKPIRSLSNEEQADLATKLSAPVLAAFNAGVIGKQTTLKELKQISDVTNIFSNITDEAIQSASDDTGPGPGEMAQAQLDAFEEGGMGGPGEKPEEGAAKKGAAAKEPGEELPGAKGKSKNVPVAKSKGKSRSGKDAITWPAREPSGSLYLDEATAKQESIFRQTWDHAIEGRAEFQGLQILIENDIGSTRKGVDPNGEPWQVLITWPYGFVSGTRGIDGDEVDCFLGPNPDAEFAYVVTLGKSDRENKVMLGFDSEEQAKQAFLENYSDPQFFGSIETLSMADFRKRLKSHKGKRIPGEKQSKASVQYVDVADKAKQSCQYCQYFVAPGMDTEGPQCQKVEGVISPAGWCDVFDPRQAIPTVDAVPMPPEWVGVDGLDPWAAVQSVLIKTDSTMKVDGKDYEVFDEGGSWMVREYITPTSPDDESDYREALVGKDKAATAEEAVRLAVKVCSWA